MKKVIASLLFIMILTFTVVTVSANETTTNQYCFDEIGVDITFEDDNSLTEEQKERIAEILAYDLTPSETRAWCWLTGHDKVVHLVTKTTHKFRDLSPRCLAETYDVTVCNNCNYYDEELIAQYYVICCPEE
jgi:hypothetical protein